MGMRQRLGLAGTLLGDPRVLILDEPANGLDPEGIRWLRGFFRHLAGEGRTVLVSSHQLAEVQEVADRAVILNRGKLVRAGTLGELSAGTATTVVRGPALGPLQQALAGAGFGGTTEPDGGAADSHRPAGPRRPPGLRPQRRAARAPAGGVRPGAAVLQPDRGRAPRRGAGSARPSPAPVPGHRRAVVNR